MSGNLNAVPVKPEFDRKYITISFTLLILVVVFFSWLHWVNPQVLRVPSLSDVSTWQHPAFDQTLIYQRMTPEERSRVLREGLPGADLGTVLFTDISGIFVALLCFLHARRYWGDWMAFTFLMGSFIFTGLQESIWILFGRFTGMAAGPGLGSYEVAGTYWFTKGGLWFIETPVFACVGWFYLAYTVVLVAGKVFPQTGLWGRAAIGALIALGFDLWQDPVVVSPELMSWVWSHQDVVHILGIPQSNFLGWFLLIFFFAIVWEQLPKWEKKWGRAKATRNFFVILVVADFGVLATLSLWHHVLRAILMLFGVEHTVMFPQGW